MWVAKRMGLSHPKQLLPAWWQWWWARIADPTSVPRWQRDLDCFWRYYLLQSEPCPGIDGDLRPFVMLIRVFTLSGMLAFALSPLFAFLLGLATRRLPPFHSFRSWY